MRNWKQHEKAHAELKWRLLVNEKYETETIDRDKIT